jgi:hypothetical protein
LIDVRDAMPALKPHERIALLSQMLGYSYEEIAQLSRGLLSSSAQAPMVCIDGRSSTRLSAVDGLDCVSGLARRDGVA